MDYKKKQVPIPDIFWKIVIDKMSSPEKPNGIVFISKNGPDCNDYKLVLNCEDVCSDAKWFASGICNFHINSYIFG